ncbi:MAG: competence protein CoiA family protein, partial [archaeon]
MDRCIYNNLNIFVEEVATDFNKEKSIRELSSKNLLECYDCKNPVIYRRGEIRRAHFSHKNLLDCDYQKYS